MTNTNIEQSIGQLIMSLAMRFDEEDKQQFNEYIEKMNTKYAENSDLYESEIALARLRFDEYAALPFQKANTFLETNRKKLAIIKYLYNGLMEHFLRRYIEAHEGTSCSADKVRFIISQIKKSLIDGENQSLYEEYSKNGRMAEHAGKQCYWSPKTLEDTDQVIEMFWKWYNVDVDVTVNEESDKNLVQK